jgi:hypothetical protein
MVTNKLCHATNYVELEGVSDDDKPTENIGVNSKFHELDTGKQFYFDGESWAEIGGET